MSGDRNVELFFSLFIPRYEATGVDPNDLRLLMTRIERWDDWCRHWSELGARHERLAEEAEKKGHALTSAEAYVRASIYYHYGKHLFADHLDEYRIAHDSMIRCYSAGATKLPNPVERIEFPFRGSKMAGWLRKPLARARPPVAVVLPGLDACKEELHAWASGFIDRGVAALTLDGPGQGETAFLLPTTPDWGEVLGAVIDVLEERDDIDGSRVGVVGQSLGAIYAPLAAAGEPRLKACIANCGPFDFGATFPKIPEISQKVYQVHSRSTTMEEARAVARRVTLEGKAEKIKCPLLIVFGAGDKIIPPSEGERLAKAASGPTELIVYEEGNHVCFNISYKFRPLTGDWMAAQLGV